MRHILRLRYGLSSLTPPPSIGSIRVATRQSNVVRLGGRPTVADDIDARRVFRIMQGTSDSTGTKYAY
ncbi:Uu.00g104090.m01.CDS01 [Anthostomella pinea]|uniref:Uu.00g104090.m01.CDS01 n=1 Tax=Anthostomella pinea TaxID=933095 RepID=A0AAI8YFT1_9PEZI|nr:Uu.00g104090.m01.CDS01 [Anthostomella pinea]